LLLRVIFIDREDAYREVYRGYRQDWVLERRCFSRERGLARLLMDEAWVETGQEVLTGPWDIFLLTLSACGAI
jgi:hypothetical protein